MDLDQILFGLDPFITDSVAGKPTTNDVFKESYLTLLSQLSVLLRNPEIRDQPLFKDNVVNFITATAKLLNVSDARDSIMELLKVLINGIADNDENRDVLLNNEEFCVNVIKFLQDDFNDDEVNERLFLLFQNLIVEDVENGTGKGKYLEKVSKLLSEQLFWYLQYNWENKLGIEVFVDLIMVDNAFLSDANKIDSALGKLIMLLEKYREKDFITDDDGIDEVIVNYSKILEVLTLDLRVKFDSTYELKLQQKLLKVFKLAEDMEIPNKLKFQRQIYTSIGNISSNYTATNRIGLKVEDNEKNGYVISSICLILGNSISSSEDKIRALETYPNLITAIVHKFQYLTDPILFQGYLQLMKNIISMENYSELFQDFSQFQLIIESVLRNAKYYPNLTQLFSAFFKKLIVLINKDQLYLLLSINEILSIYEDQTIILLILNKLIIYKYQDSALLNKLISKAMKITQNQKIEISQLFELTKTIGLLSNHHPELLIKDYTPELITLLTTIDELQNNNGAVNAVKNNARYIGGNLLEKSDGELHQISKHLLQNV